MNNKDSLLKGTLVYTSANVITKLGGLVFLPIMTRILTAQEYGIIGILSPITTIFTIILGLGFYNVSMKKYVDLKDNENELGSFNFTIIFSIFILCLFVMAILFLPISKKIFLYIVSVNYTLILISIMISMVNAFNNIALTLFRMKRNYFRVAVGSLISFFTNYFLAIFFIKKLGLGVFGNQLANLIAVFTLFVYFYIEYFKTVKPKFSKNYLTYSLYNGIPLIFIELTDQLVNFSDRLILSKFNISLAVIGAYTLAYTGSRVLGIITSSFVGAFTPVLYENIKASSKKLENFLAILMFFCVIGTLFANEAITLIFPPHYKQAVLYMPIVLTAVMAQALYALDYYFHYNEKSAYIIYFTLLSLVINVVLNVIFIPIYPQYAVIIASLTTLIAFLIRDILELYLIKKWFDIEFNYFNLLKYLFIAFNPLIWYLAIAKISINIILLKLIYIVIAVLLTYKEVKSWIKYLQSLLLRIIEKIS
ncbi:oligosaccharide flippase family protein [Caviibacter abscessus]|uniref:oligosaccharide flippase family protein n=1 Tax=Caviibacter abscessus TaxID=1766719 RepID=UPI00082F8098|nr:oligosaccharide flippase family protein [Caviibacter abscessus]